MGNLCGKQSSDPFAQPGRTLGSAPAPASGTAPLPRVSAAPRPGRTLGGGRDDSDARRAAALAAEERAKANAPKGKLARDLASQRQQTRVDTLGQASEQERRYRDADESAAARNWD
ncbi:MAG: hypothetical protein M1823_005751 [Watsoniomyces obsoletus]|nr:MAG: hypothetical protein M1823_005751 [Watsoniomyces obsoletus]